MAEKSRPNSSNSNQSRKNSKNGSEEKDRNIFKNFFDYMKSPLRSSGSKSPKMKPETSTPKKSDPDIRNSRKQLYVISRRISHSQSGNTYKSFEELDRKPRSNGHIIHTNRCDILELSIRFLIQNK